MTGHEYQDEFNNFVEQIENGNVTPKSPDSVPLVGNTTKEQNNDDEDELAITGVDHSKVGTTVDKDASEYYRDIVAEKLSKVKDIDANAYDERVNKLAGDIEKYKKELITKNGFTEEEANEAAKSRAARLAADSANQFFEANPQLAIVRVDKTNTDNLNFTEEEKQKLVKVPTIRLVEVEDKSLATLKLKKVDDKVPLRTIIQRHTCNISKYNIPLLNTFDYAYFAGATTIQMLNLMVDPEDQMDPLTMTNNKISLAYDRFLGSTTREKFGPDGNPIMTLDDFANWLKFEDLDTAIYAIYVASSTEMIDTVFGCRTEQCVRAAREEAHAKNPRRSVREIVENVTSREFNNTFNCKQAIAYPDIPERFKKDMDDILGNNDRHDMMLEMQTERRGSVRYKSNWTNNVYELEVPSCAKMINILTYTANADDTDQYMATLAAYIKNIYVYAEDDENGEPVYYPPVDGNNVEDVIEIIKNLTDTENTLLLQRMQNISYRPQFRIKTKCPHCGNEAELTYNIAEMVFLKARGTEVAIEQSTNSTNM